MPILSQCTIIVPPGTVVDISIDSYYIISGIYILYLGVYYLAFPTKGLGPAHIPMMVFPGVA